MADGLSGYINTAIKFADFCLKLQAAPEETKVFCRLIQRVRSDRSEALRERTEKARILQDFPKKRKWIDDAIHDTTEALQTIGRLVEGARIDMARGKKVSLQHRFEWVMTKKEDFVTKQSLLATCHQSLSTVIVYMQNLQAVPAASLLSPPPSYEDSGPALVSPAARKPRPKQSFVLPDSVSEAGGLTEEWERSLCMDPLASYPAETRSEASSNDNIIDGTPRDDICQADAAAAAAAAISNVGGNSKTAAAIAESLQQSNGSNERRRRREAHFGHSASEAGDSNESGLSTQRPDLLSRSNTSERRLRMAAHFASG
ncbi:hypothetical protein LTR85_005216 [Meristemomyces frigidus]|nr:hypothetical protein LTR85_005216 [Meristemomyces frigidus]